MKKILQIMSVITLTTVTTINLSACDFFQGSPPVDWNQRLEDAAKLISTNTDIKFNTFFYDKNKTKTKVSDFERDIKERIEKLFKNSTENYSLLRYNITNGNDFIKNDSATIALDLLVEGVPNVRKSCTFEAKFTDVQTFVNKKLAPYTDNTKINKQHFILKKEDKFFSNAIDKENKDLSFYDILVGYGAKFSNTVNLFKTTDKGTLGTASDFWTAFETAKGSGTIETAYLGNVLYPIFQMFGFDKIGGLSFFNFQATLQADAGGNLNVIALTGHKSFNGHDYEYIEINLKGVNTEDVDLNNNFKGLTYIFQ